MVDPQEIERLVNTAMQLDRSGRVDDAIVAYETVLRKFPNLPDCWYNLGVLQRRMYRFDAALAAYDQALHFGIDGPEEVHLNKAIIYSDHLHRPEVAERELQQALARNPNFGAAQFNLANLYEDLGRRQEAADVYQRIFQQDDRCFEALARFAALQKVAGPDDPLLGQLRAALRDEQASPADRSSVAFSLGQLLDACGDYGGAFAAYAEGNRLSRASAPPQLARYDRDALERYFAQLRGAFRGTNQQATLRFGAQRPVFICGLFRSGSTLVERMLAGHPDVRAGGELELVPRMVGSLLQPLPAAASLLTANDLDRLAGAYLDYLRQAFPGARLVTDKRPDNFQYIGFIKMLFPQAKIVHTMRDPLDVCLSMYFLHLDQRMSYALDLADLGHYYRQYHQLMAHWRALYPDDILDVDYDLLVQDPRPVAGRLLEFCGLDWNERCLDVGRADGVVKSASVWQAREPVYQRSSGRWRNYREHLAPLRAALGDLCPVDG